MKIRSVPVLPVIVLAFVIGMVSNSIAGDKPGALFFDFSARYRFESWNGMNARYYGSEPGQSMGSPTDNLLYQRILTGFTWTPSRQVTVGMHLQDSRAFGWTLRNSKYPDLFRIGKSGTEQTGYLMNPGEEFFEVYDLFIEYRQFIPNITAKVGRQKIFFGDNHVFGPGDWGNTGRWTWDALRLTWQKGRHSADLFGGGTKIHDPQHTAIPFTETEFWGGGAYGHFEIPEILVVEPFYALKRQGSADYIRQQDIHHNWLGARLFDMGDEGLVLDGTVAWQFGRQNGKAIQAWGLFAKIGYQFHGLWSTPIISVRESYASGGKKQDTLIRTFEPAFGASDKYYGWMNIVSWSNLDDREINLELFPIEGMWVEIKANRYIVPEPEASAIMGTLKLAEGERHLGDELNIFVRWQQNTHWQWVGVLGHFRPGNVSYIGDKPAGQASWIALQLQYTL